VELSEVEQKWSLRLERERKARRQAEQHAEQGLRELWLANQRLESAVAARTAELDRSLAALDFAARTRRLLLADLADELLHPVEALEIALARAAAAEPDDGTSVLMQRARGDAAHAASLTRLLGIAAHAASPTSIPDTESRSPQTVIDELVRRWQIPFARRGKLLAPNLSSADQEVILLWEPLVGAADAVLESAAQHSLAGTLEIELKVSADDVRMHIVDAGLAAPIAAINGSAPSAVAWLEGGEHCVGIAVAQRMVAGTDITLTVSATDDGGTSIVIRATRPTP
jgi:signal transduction histidine kinase